MKTKAKIVALKTNEEQNEQFKREWEAYQKERENFTINEAELDAILGELIDALDQHLIESAFNFRIGLDDSEGHWSKRPYLDEFIQKLCPYNKHRLKKLSSVLPHRYQPPLPGEPDSDLYSLIGDVQDNAYVVGIFMGAKLAGASKDTLNLLRKHLML